MSAGSHWSFHTRYPCCPSSGFCKTKRSPVSLRLFSTLEAHPPGLTQADAVERTIGACRQSLGQHCLDVLGNPAHPESFDRLMQGGLRKAILFSQGCESARSFLLVGARDGTRRLPGRIWRKRLLPSERMAL